MARELIVPVFRFTLQSKLLTGRADCSAGVLSGRNGKTVAIAGTLALICLSWSVDVFAQSIKTDASWGRTAQTLTGPKYDIPQAMGKLAGNNLFHSFETFNIKTNESAVFSTTTASLQNVISRVSGGSASSINGLLQLTPAAGSAPNFFFINPAGVTFGDGALIDVQGAFHVSTANSLKFADGAIFNAGTGADSTFTVAAPQAFGFLGTQRSSITIKEGAFLATMTSQPLSLTAGDIVIDRAVVGGFAGDIRVAALGAQPGDWPILGASAVPDRSPIAPGGTIRVVNGGVIVSVPDGELAAGNIEVRAGTLTIDGQGSPATNGIISQAELGTSGSAGNIDIAVIGTVSILNEGQIATNTYTSGNGGKVKLTAGGLTIDGRYTGIVGAAISGSSGLAGSIDVTVNGVASIANGGQITSGTFSSGNAGTVKLTADHLTIDGEYSGILGLASLGSSGSAGNIDVTVSGAASLTKGGKIAASTLSSGNAGRVKFTADSLMIVGEQSGIFDTAEPGSSGSAGNIEIAVNGTASILNGGRTSSSTFSPGNAGAVTLTAGGLTIDGQGSPNNTGIFDRADSGTGSAGNIDVTVNGTALILNGGVISTATFSSGNAGTVKVAAGSLTIDRKGSSNFTGISSDTLLGSAGDAGNIVVNASRDLSLLRGGDISSATYALPGRAGSVTINAGTVLVNGASSSINASANAGSSGQTGSVLVNASDGILLSDGGMLAIQNGATVVDPGSLTPTALLVSAPNITLKNAQITAASTSNVAASNIQVSFSDRLSLDPSRISTSANSGNGGSIRIQGGKLMVLDKAQITTSVLGASGNGGDIGVKADVLVMNTGFIQANTAAVAASGGNVMIDVGALIPSGNTLTLGSRSAHAIAQEVFGYNVIEAAAPDGISGNIQVSSPALDLAGALGGLSTAMIDFGALGKDPCRVGAGSSLTPVGRGGLPPTAGGLIRPEPKVMEIPARAGEFPHGARLAQAPPPAQMPVGRGCR